METKQFHIFLRQHWSYQLKMSKWSCYTQTALNVYTRGEMSNRSKRKCLHGDKTLVQRISLELQHLCGFSIEWQHCSYVNVTRKLLTSFYCSLPSFFSLSNDLNYYYVTLLEYVFTKNILHCGQSFTTKLLL